MKNLGTVRLETDRLILRPFKLEDADEMFQNWANDSLVTKFLTWEPHESADASRKVLESWISNYENQEFYQWGIVVKETNELVGSISVVEIDSQLEKLQIGYCISRKWWRKGITSEALTEVIRFFMEEVGVNRIEAKHDVNNPNSGKVMKKCGMKFEGVLRQASKNNKGICDCCMYSIIANDYFQDIHSKEC